MGYMRSAEMDQAYLLSFLIAVKLRRFKPGSDRQRSVEFPLSIV
jgi:hypothetical protein